MKICRDNAKNWPMNNKIVSRIFIRGEFAEIGLKQPEKSLVVTRIKRVIKKEVGRILLFSGRKPLPD